MMEVPPENPLINANLPNVCRTEPAYAKVKTSIENKDCDAHFISLA